MASADAVLVGSGINALVAAALLAKAGWQVQVLERNDSLGGAVQTAEITVPSFQHHVFSAWHPLFVRGAGERRGPVACGAGLGAGDRPAGRAGGGAGGSRWGSCRRPRGGMPPAGSTRALGPGPPPCADAAGTASGRGWRRTFSIFTPP